MSYRQAYTELEGQFTTVVGATVSGVAAVSASIGNAELEDNAASGLKVSSEFGTVFAGSPAARGRSVYAGTAATAAGSAAWVVFPLSTTFGAAPLVIAQNEQAAGVTFFIPAGSRTPGSFYIQSSAASSSFSYVAIGSGRLA